MAVLLITFDLKKPEQAYAEFYATIKRLNVWAKLTESSYAVETHLLPAQIFELLQPHLDTNDILHVVTLAGPWISYAPQDVNDWLRARIGLG